MHNLIERVRNNDVSLYSLDATKYSNLVTHSEYKNQFIDAVIGNSVIRELNLSSMLINDEMVRKLANRQIPFTKLDLSHNKIHDDTIIALTDSMQIQSLNLSETLITHKSIQHLMQKNKLKSLFLEGIKFSEKTTNLLLKNMNLKNLRISLSKIKLEDLESLEPNYCLEELSLIGCKINDVLLTEILNKFKGLRTLQLSDNNITDNGAALLAQNDTLVQLFLEDNQNTDTGLDIFIHALQNNNTTLCHLSIENDNISLDTSKLIQVYSLLGRNKGFAEEENVYTKANEIGKIKKIYQAPNLVDIGIFKVKQYTNNGVIQVQDRNRIHERLRRNINLDVLLSKEVESVSNNNCNI